MKFFLHLFCLLFSLVLFMVDGYRFSRRRKHKGRVEGWRERERIVGRKTVLKGGMRNVISTGSATNIQRKHNKKTPLDRGRSVNL